MSGVAHLVPNVQWVRPHDTIVPTSQSVPGHRRLAAVQEASSSSRCPRSGTMLLAGAVLALPHVRQGSRRRELRKGVAVKAEEVKVYEGADEVKLDGPRPAGQGGTSGHPYFWKMGKDKRFIEVVFPIDDDVTKDDIVYRMGDDSRDPLRGPSLQMGYRIKDSESGSVREQMVVDGNILNRIDRRECFWNLEDMGGVKVCVLTLSRPRMTRKVHDMRTNTTYDEERLDPQTWDAVLLEERCQPRTTHKVYFDIALSGEPAGRLEFSLFGDDVPKTVQNLLGLIKGEYQNESGETVATPFCLKGTTFDKVKGDQLMAAGQPGLECETIKLTADELEEYTDFFKVRKSVTPWPMGPIGMGWMLRWGADAGVKEDETGFVLKKEKEQLDLEQDLPVIVPRLEKLVEDGQGGELVFFKPECRNGVNIFGTTFPAENLALPHFGRGVLSMDRDEDEDRQGSVFFITLREFPEMDGKYCPFGVLTDGHQVLDRIEEDYEDLPKEVTIEDCGVLTES